MTLRQIVTYLNYACEYNASSRKLDSTIITITYLKRNKIQQIGTTELLEIGLSHNYKEGFLYLKRLTKLNFKFI